VPPSTFFGQFRRKADIKGLVSLYIFGPWGEGLGDKENLEGGRDAGRSRMLLQADQLLLLAGLLCQGMLCENLLINDNVVVDFHNYQDSKCNYML
jgi:hypothetical protein